MDVLGDEKISSDWDLNSDPSIPYLVNNIDAILSEGLGKP
jgi:hypothetical protein